MSQLSFEKSFASHEKSKFWSDRNELKPENVSSGTHKKYWFSCITCKHDFEASLRTITKGSWCSYCSNKNLCKNEECHLCFDKSFSSHEKSKQWSEKNNPIRPRDVFKSSGKEYYFKCHTCNHEYISEPDKIIKNKSECPYCNISSHVLCLDDNCQTCFKRSFASHPKSKYWSDNNKQLKPRDIFKISGKKYLFNCDCGHEFDKIISDITSNGSWCPYCCEPVQKLCEDIECSDCFQKSFASHEKSEYWTDKNKLKPRDVVKSSNKKYIFNCNICLHEFETSLDHISLYDGWCSYCSKKKLCDNNECINCFENSFLSFVKSKNWSLKNELNPRDVFKVSGKEYLFLCDKGHEFKSILSNIVKGQWCPFCKNKTEQKLLESLQIDYPHIQHQFKVDWCKNELTNKHLPFDFVLENEKIIIELDGRQHFEQVSNWSTPEEQYERDSYKMKCANENGYSIIRITQEDVFNDTFDWYTLLKDSIKTIIDKKSIENHFISFEENVYHHLL